MSHIYIQVKSHMGQNVHKFEKLGHSDLVISMCLAMHICVRHEGSGGHTEEVIIVKKKNGCHLKCKNILG